MDYIANIRVKNDNPTQSFGGLNFFFSSEVFNRSMKVVESCLGSRQRQGVRYDHFEIITALAYSILAGGSAIEDVNRIRRDLEQTPDHQAVASSDTVLRYLSELSVDNIYETSSSNLTYAFNVNGRLNQMLLRVTMSLLGLKKGDRVDFDYDNVIVETEKYEAKYTYYDSLGFCPGGAFICGLPVYIENRDGNAPVVFRQEDTLKRIFSLLDQEGLKIRRAVMDAGSYTEAVINTVSTHAETFYIRAINTDYYRSLSKEAGGGWEKLRLSGGRTVEARRLDFDNFKSLADRGYEIVLYRYRTDDNRKALFEEMEWRTFAILTNDKKHTNKEIIEIYNKRGAVERNFDQLKNDFNWSHLPSSELKCNTVFMILTAMLRNIYAAFSRELAKCAEWKETSRLKSFIYHFVTCPAQWIREEKGWCLHLLSPPEVLHSYVQRYYFR